MNRTPGCESWKKCMAARWAALSNLLTDHAAVLSPCVSHIQVEGAYEDWIEVLRLVYYGGRSGQPSVKLRVL